MSKIKEALIVSILLGTFHYILHQYAGLPFMNVGIYLFGGYFIFRAFFEEKVLRMVG